MGGHDIPIGRFIIHQQKKKKKIEQETIHANKKVNHEIEKQTKQEGTNRKHTHTHTLDRHTVGQQRVSGGLPFFLPLRESAHSSGIEKKKCFAVVGLFCKRNHTAPARNHGD